MGLIEDRVRESIGTKQKILNDKGLISLIQETAYMMAGVLAAGRWPSWDGMGEK